MSPHSQRKSKRGDELCVVADFRMDIEREMRAIKRHVSFESELKLPPHVMQAAGPPTEGQVRVEIEELGEVTLSVDE